jgi:hypothetical protein
MFVVQQVDWELWREDLKLIWKPSQVGLGPTPVGFAAFARAKCAFIV